MERHPGGDEMLHILDGEVDITVLTDDGRVETTARAGSIFVCPKGLWHRQMSRSGVTVLYATPTKRRSIRSPTILGVRTEISN